MLDQTTIDAAAKRLWQEQKAHQLRTTMPEAAAGTLEDAYRIQDALQQ